MKNSVKYDWKRRMCSSLFALLLAILLAAGWQAKRTFGLPFSSVLGLDSGKVTHIAICSAKNETLHITREEDVQAFMSYLSDFRYADVFDINAPFFQTRAGCGPENWIELYGSSGRLLKRLDIHEESVIQNGVWYYNADSVYFAPLLHLP